MAPDLRELIDALRASKRTTDRAIASECEQFSRLIPLDTHMALVRARRALEAMLRAAGEVSGISGAKRPLEHIISELTQLRDLPPLVERHCRVVKDFGNLAAHELNEVEGSLSLFATEGEWCSRSLAVVGTWYVEKVIPRCQHAVTFRVLAAHEIEDRHLVDARNIDEFLYPPEYWSEPATLIAWNNRNPDIFTLVADVATQKVVACLTAVPVEDDLFLTIEQGELAIDTQLPLDMIRQYDLPDFYRLYVASVVIDPAYHNTAVFKVLYDGFIDKLLYLARKEIFFVEVLGNAITADGERLARFAGMQTVGATALGTKVVKLTLLPPSMRVTTQKAKQLALFYERRYEEFRELLGMASQRARRMP